MNASLPLTGAHQRTHEAIFRHPAPHNLAWRDVHALLAELGQVTTEANGHLRVTRNGHSLILHAPHTKEIAELSTLTELRRFLEQSETAVAPASGSDGHWLVVINHHEALVYRSFVHGNVPLQVLPHASEAFFRHASHSKDFSRGQEKPDAVSFFGPVVKALGLTGKVVVFGSGKGTGSEMVQFIHWVKQHQPALAARIIGSVVIDQHHTTPAQLLAQAREFYATIAPSLLR